MRELIRDMAIFTAIISVVALFSSCNKDNENDQKPPSPYEGTWVCEEMINNEPELYIDATLTKDTFAFEVCKRTKGTLFLPVTIEAKGNFIASNNEMSLLYTEISLLQQDMKTIITLKKGDSGFNDATRMLDDYAKFAYEVEENELVLTPLTPNASPHFFKRTAQF